MNNKRFCLGIDTSNYTTSAAIVDGELNIIADSRRLLEVKQGERGLRQSQALFEHMGNLPGVFEELFRQAEDAPGFSREGICAVAVSERPRPVEGSYMPVFRAGIAQGKVLAETLGVPCFGFSHQEGHLAAALPDSGLKPEGEFLALHLSGGTTEVLKCRKRQEGTGPAYEIEIVGGTKDLSYGKLIDRVGVALGMTFPCGKGLDRIAMEQVVLQDSGLLPDFCRVQTADGRINLSGIETQILRYIKDWTDSGKEADEITGAVAVAMMDRIGESLLKMINQCREKTGIRPALLSGGVAASRYLREKLKAEADLYFGRPERSSDNAAGTAILGMERVLKK